MSALAKVWFVAVHVVKCSVGFGSNPFGFLPKPAKNRTKITVWFGFFSVAGSITHAPQLLKVIENTTNALSERLLTLLKVIGILQLYE